MDNPTETKRKRGRPPTGTAMSAAERQAKYREGKAGFNVLLTEQTAEAFRAYLQKHDLKQNEVIEKLIVSQILRKR